VLTGIVKDREIAYKISKSTNKIGLDGSFILNILLKRPLDLSIKEYLKVI